MYLKNFPERVSVGRHELDTQYLWDAYDEEGSAKHKRKKT